MAYKVAFLLSICATFVSLMFGFYQHNSWALLLALVSTPWSVIFIRDQDVSISFFKRPLRSYLFQAFIVAFMVVYSVYVVGMIVGWVQHSLRLTVLFAYLLAGALYVARDATQPIFNQPNYVRSWLKRFLVALIWPYAVVRIITMCLPFWRYRKYWREALRFGVPPFLVFSVALLILRINQLQ